MATIDIKNYIKPELLQDDQPNANHSLFYGDLSGKMSEKISVPKSRRFLKDLILKDGYQINFLPPKLKVKYARLALKTYPVVICYIKNPTIEECRYASSHWDERFPFFIANIRKQYEEICLEALEKNVYHIRFIAKKFQTKKVVSYVIDKMKFNHQYDVFLYVSNIKNITLESWIKLLLHRNGEEEITLLTENIPKKFLKNKELRLLVEYGKI